MTVDHWAQLIRDLKAKRDVALRDRDAIINKLKGIEETLIEVELRADKAREGKADDT